MLVLRSFCDGSSGAKTLTLGAVAAHTDPWRDAVSRWRQMLSRHGMSALHMKEFSPLNGCFTGKSRADSVAVVDEAVRLISTLNCQEFQLTTCTVNLGEYACAAGVYPWYAEGPSQKRAVDLCVDWCISGLPSQVTHTDDCPKGSRIVIAFDQNENFLSRLVRVYEQKRHAPHWYWAWRLLTTPMPLDSGTFVELQFSDLAAWVCTRHYNEGDREDWFNAIHQHWARPHKLYDYNALSDRAKARDPGLYMELPQQRRKQLAAGISDPLASAETRDDDDVV